MSFTRKVLSVVSAPLLFSIPTVAERMLISDADMELQQVEAGGDGEDQFLTTTPNKCGWPKELEEQALLETNISLDKAHECSSSEWRTFKKDWGMTDPAQKTLFYKDRVCKENNVVWFYPVEDHNGAFNINRNVCYRLTEWAKRACSVHFYRIEDPSEAEVKLKMFPTRSIRHLVLGGHGSGQTLGWGHGAGMMGVTMKVGKVPLGAVVMWERGLGADYRGNYKIEPRTKGLVTQADRSKALVMFEGHKRSSSMDVSFFKDAKIVVLPTARLMKEVQYVMQTHGSIFLDSCLAATPKVDVNLADYVASAVGQGVRVIGSEVSFGHVDVTRFDGWWTEIHTNEMRNAQRVYINGARCPSWAVSRYPDQNGNCGCDSAKEICMTASGKSCRAAHGLSSKKEFLPSCAEDWMEDNCVCKPVYVPATPEPTPAPSPSVRPSPGVRILKRCPVWAESKYADEVGNCQCPSDKVCRTRFGKVCARRAGYTSRRDFDPFCADCSCVAKKPSVRVVEGRKLGCTVGSGFGKDFSSNDDGNCVCTKGYICKTLRGKDCPFYGQDSAGNRAFRASCSIINGLERDVCLCRKQ